MAGIQFAKISSGHCEARESSRRFALCSVTK
jgi:hypothetical protein